jgi:hypothetical protein
MSRTTRRGRCSRNIQHYLNASVIWSKTQGFHSLYDGEFIVYWKDSREDQRSYDQYVADEIRKYHQDKRQHGIERRIRKADRDIQTRAHKRAIRNAVKTGDYDVVLAGLDQFHMLNET